MKYKVGDKVRVREDLIVGKGYGWFSFVKTMEEHLGEVGTIRGVDPQTKSYGIEEDDGEAYWTDEMLEPIEDTLVEELEE